MHRPRLGVNIDHIATLRQARGTRYPEPLLGVQLAQLGGADQITVHLREDRRHIQDRDVRLLREVVTCPLNLEMGLTDEMIAIALEVRPDTVTLVPERREERTTEGGLDLRPRADAIADFAAACAARGIELSLFIEASEEQIRLAKQVGAAIVELHTGEFAEAKPAQQAAEVARLRSGAQLAKSLGLTVAAGHGLHYENIFPLLEIVEIEEYNIGHAIVARALFVGFQAAVAEMVVLLGDRRPPHPWRPSTR